MTEFTDARWVRVLADHASTGIWAREGWPAELDELPVSAPLKERIRLWQLAYEQNRDWDGDYSFDVEGSSREGLAIARAVKVELPGWTVIYRDEAAYKRDPDGPRELCEYEIRAAA